MKKIIGIVAASAFAIAAFSAPVAAANDNAIADGQCFGGVHKFVNSGGLDGVDNVGQLVQSLENKGQGKKAVAQTFC